EREHFPLIGRARHSVRAVRVNCKLNGVQRTARPTHEGRTIGQTLYNPLLESGAATCSSDRRSAGTPIHASVIAPKIINAAATKYPMNNAVTDPVPAERRSLEHVAAPLS